MAFTSIPNGTCLDLIGWTTKYKEATAKLKERAHHANDPEESVSLENGRTK